MQTELPEQGPATDLHTCYDNCPCHRGEPPQRDFLPRLTDEQVLHLFLLLGQRRAEGEKDAE